MGGENFFIKQNQDVFFSSLKQASVKTGAQYGFAAGGIAALGKIGWSIPKHSIVKVSAIGCCIVAASTTSGGMAGLVVENIAAGKSGATDGALLGAVTGSGLSFFVALHQHWEAQDIRGISEFQRLTTGTKIPISFFNRHPLLRGSIAGLGAIAASVATGAVAGTIRDAKRLEK